MHLNEAALWEQFQYRFVAGERTLYNDVQRLLPGTFLEIKNGITTKTYYRVTDGQKQDAPSRVDYDEIETLLEESIHAHTVSDVGYSIQLSGGIDSSYITTILSQDQKELDTYSVSLPGIETDEAQYQRQVVEKCGTRAKICIRPSANGREAGLGPKPAEGEGIKGAASTRFGTEFRQFLQRHLT